MRFLFASDSFKGTISFARAAELHGMSFSAYIRSCLMAELSRAVDDQ